MTTNIVDWYYKKVDWLFDQMERVVDRVKELGKQYPKDEHRIYGYFLASVVNYTTSIVQCAITDKAISLEDALKIRDYAVNKLRKFVEEKFGRLGMLLLEKYFNKILEVKSVVFKQIESSVLEDESRKT